MTSAYYVLSVLPISVTVIEQSFGSRLLWLSQSVCRVAVDRPVGYINNRSRNRFLGTDTSVLADEAKETVLWSETLFHSGGGGGGAIKAERVCLTRPRSNGYRGRRYLCVTGIWSSPQLSLCALCCLAAHRSGSLRGGHKDAVICRLGSWSRALKLIVCGAMGMSGGQLCA